MSSSPRPAPWLFAALIATQLVAPSASAQSAIDSMNDAFRAAPLVRSQPRSTHSPTGLDNLDEPVVTGQSDGPVREAQSVHPTIAAVRGALWYWLDETERRRLSTVDATLTSAADTRTLQLFLVDRALRRFAPLALAALERRNEAIALRNAPPIRTIADADAVGRLPAVTRVMRRRESIETSTSAAFARRMQRLGASISSASMTEHDREFAADRAVVAAAEAARTRDPAEIAIVIAETNIAFGGRAARSVVVDEALHLLEELVAIARGNPAVERPLPPLPVRIDPDAADLPIAVASAPEARPTRGATATRARPGRSSARGSTGNQTPPLVRRAGPDVRCYDDFRCFQDE